MFSLIYVIAGLAKSGKSLVASRILKTRQMHVISTDWIMMMLYHGNPDLKIDIHKSDMTVSRQLEPYIEGLFAALVQSQKDILIEGVHIQPALMSKLMERYPSRIKCVFLGYKDIDPVLKASQLKAHAPQIDNPWYLSMDDAGLLKLTQYLTKESQKLYESCLIYGQNYIEIQDINQDEPTILNELFS